MTDRTRPGTAATVGALALDAALVIVFAIIGRSSHAEGLDVVGVWGTAWPFLAGLAVGWAAARAWRHPRAPWPTGVIVWAATLVVGMLLRLASDQGVQVAFVIVAALTLAILLVGWRGVVALIARGSGTRAATGTP
jgi:hypothetical protein